MAFDDPDLVGREAINSGKRRHLRVVVEIGGQRVPRENVFLGQETARHLRVNKIVVCKTEITEQTKNAFLLFSISRFSSQTFKSIFKKISKFSAEGDRCLSRG